MEQRKDNNIFEKPKYKDGVSEEKITESKFTPSREKPSPFTSTDIGTPYSASESVSNSLLLN